MKIAAIIEEFNFVSENHRQFIHNVRKQTGADVLIAVMSGDFLQQGLPAGEDKYRRAVAAVDAGVDLVIELPVYCTLSSPDTYAYAAVSVLERLGCVDELAIACTTEGTDSDLLSDIVLFLFKETKEFQDEIRELRSRGMSFYDAQAKTVGRFIPGAENILKDSENIFAAEFARAMKRMYSTMSPRFIQAHQLSPLNQTAPQKPSGTHSFVPQSDLCPSSDARLCALLKDALYVSDNQLCEIFGGTSMLTESIVRLRDSFAQQNRTPEADAMAGSNGIPEASAMAGSNGSFDAFAGSLKTPTRSQANIRRYLLSLILGIRKSDIAICRLYSFSLYARIIGCSANAAPLIRHLQKKAWMPVFLQLPEDETAALKEAFLKSEALENAADSGYPAKLFSRPTLDTTRQMMADIDSNAREIYIQLCS